MKNFTSPLKSGDVVFSDSAGFTLIEILMVITLLAIVSVVATSQFVDFTVDAKRTVTLNRLNELRLAITGDARMVANGQYTQPGFINQVGRVPTALTDLNTQGAYPSYDPFLKKGWAGPYISTNDANWNQDAWGTAFQYNAGLRTITSCGPDLTCGTADDITVSF